MKKPQLTITENSGTVPVEGGCTSCPDVKFHVKVPGRLERSSALTSLEDQFDRHFQKVHMHEDASQAASRIVREATEGN